MLFLKIRKNQVGQPLITNIEGTKNGMADVASRIPGGTSKLTIIFQLTLSFAASFLGCVPLAKRVNIAHDCLSAWRAMGDGVTAQNTKDRQKYWQHWSEYCRQVKIDPMFRETSERFVLLAVTSFAARVWAGYYGNRSVVKVQSVTKALAAISKTIKLAGGKSPIYADHGVYTTPIQRMIEGFRRQDPSAVAQLAVPVEVAHTAVEAGLLSSETKEQTIGDLICIAFYYLLRVGEYTKPRTVTRNGKKVRATCTVQFTAGYGSGTKMAMPFSIMHHSKSC
ncbi:hypothetical protein CTEN210_18603 [Chaetoceros tenuissimus]|uniref:Uncharacterized protein n=1 Tax=Chaetoceros tenuissimus TaxID=426638 RepID=A0AAD3DCR8_9STRA|nr:hypothetical protein CTEN210_18603 [Chaetoceros tenuissimus]